MKINELKKILKKHSEWIEGGGGERADLSNANLRNANLRNANLRNADLWNADLSNADLSNANLSNANLRNANLQDANLSNADLSNANLSNANLRNANLRNADLWSANLSNANLSNANLRNANLRNANLQDSNLWNADLSNANLSNANLRNADLQDANLRSADLQDANNLQKIYQSDLAILKQQKGKLRAFKYLNGSISPYQNQEYKVGETYEIDNYSDDERVLCAEGLHVATLEWCLRETNSNLTRTYIEVEFDAKDIVAIPYNSDGKFRVRKLTVIREIPKSELEEYLKPLYEKEEEE